MLDLGSVMAPLAPIVVHGRRKNQRVLRRELEQRGLGNVTTAEASSILGCICGWFSIGPADSNEDNYQQHLRH